MSLIIINRSYNLLAVLLVILLFVIIAISPASATASQINNILAQSPICNPGLARYPASSLLDNSYLLDAPAGKHGFVQQKAGHFQFTNGTRVKFYGINLAKESVFIDKSTIEKLADLFARTGINLVRIHHIDDINGILDSRNPGKLNTANLDLLDYWVAQLKKRGIYLYFDLNDYRTFRNIEGVPFGEELGRGAKPYAVFDQRIIKLQQLYARKLLRDHSNPYTKLAYADDPAIALLEIYDENGLFIQRDEWDKLHEPYKSDLQLQWNAWLRYRYGTNNSLRLAWKNSLLPNENLADASIRLPNMNLERTLNFAPATVLRSPQRLSDAARFAYDTQINYLQMMRESLRNIGVKIPITAVGSQDIIPDLMANAEEMDYIGINFYWDHPAFQIDREWQLPFYFNLSDPFVDSPSYTFPLTVSRARMYGRPLVVREINYCYPNQFRGIGMMEAASYGAFLDIDALINFTYDSQNDKGNIGFFDMNSDPLRWGLMSQAARIFLEGKVQPAKYRVGIAYSATDALTWEMYRADLYQLAYSTRVENYVDNEKAHPFNILISSGRACAEKFTGARQLIFANRLYNDPGFQTTSIGPERAHGYRLSSGKTANYTFTFNGIGFAAGATSLESNQSTFLLNDLTARKLQAIAVSGKMALGFYDKSKQIIGFHNLREALAVRIALDALREWDKAPALRAALENGRRQSDTGQIIRENYAHLLRLETPALQLVAGILTGNINTSNCRFFTNSKIGTISVESLDNKPLDKTTSLLVKMTSKANNNALSILPATDGPKPFKLTSLGTAPIISGGISSDIPTRIEVAGKLQLELMMQDGNWEYLHEGKRALLYLDCGDIFIRFPQIPLKVTGHFPDGAKEIMIVDHGFFAPPNSYYFEIEW